MDQWIEATKDSRREAVALDAMDATLTYAELFTRADELSELLKRTGVREGSVVALCCPRSAAAVVCALAIMRCRAAYVPLDPESPTDRLRFMIDDSGVTVVVADPSSAARLTGGGVRVITVALEPGSAVGPRWLSESPAADRTRVLSGQLPAGLAYVVYTSGSTGAPKGVMVEHSSLLNLARWHIGAFGVHSSDRVSQIAGPGFDAAVWEIWPALAAGACVVIPDEVTRRDPRTLQQFLLRERVNVAFVPTAIAERVLDLRWPPTCALRFLLTGGDALHAVPPAGLPFVLVNSYGLTEATVVSTSGVVIPDGALASDRVGSPSIGAAIDGVELEVVDEQLQPVGDGVVGELIVSGVSVARGYLNRPELDAARFVRDERRPGKRRLRTGDRVRRRPDGRLEFLGRSDDQVKVRGYRIELGEVAAALDRHPSIASSHVVVGGDGDHDRRLDAYLVAAVGMTSEPIATPSAGELVHFLRRSLPGYMVPQTFTWVDELTLNVNGKIAGGSLSRGTAGPAAEVMAQEPWEGELLGAVSALIVELLDVRGVVPDDDFFLLGGHSLLGAQLVGRVREQFGVELRLRDVFDHPTVAGLAGRIGELVIADIELLGDDEAIALASGQV